MSNVSHDIAAEVLNTCIKLRGTADFKTTMNEVIKDIRNICGAAYCAILNIDGLTTNCSLLCEDVSPDFVDYDPGWFTEDFYEIAKTWDDVIGGSNCIILKDENDLEIIKSKSEEWFKSLKKDHVKSLVLFPLKAGYELLGYIWATNFDTSKNRRFIVLAAMSLWYCCETQLLNICKRQLVRLKSWLHNQIQ